MNDLLLFPFNGNTREAVTVIDCLNQQNKQWNLLGFIDDDPATWNKSFQGHKVLGGREQLAKHSQAKILAVPGRAENYLQRKRIIDSLDVEKSRFTILTHPKAAISKDTTIGYNTLIMAGVVTTANVAIGNHCAILPNSVLSHDVKMGDYCLMGSNVSVSGSVVIHPQCYLGSGCKVMHEIEIAEGTLIGLGSVVLKSTRPHTVLAGNPAKVLRENQL